MPLMGVREYGRYRRVSHVAVLKALRTGRIRQDAEGMIDSDEADRDWARNTHPATRAPRAQPTASSDDFGFSRARGVREHFEALLAKIEFEHRTGQLLRADEVQVARFKIDQAFREHMLRVPDAIVTKLRAHIAEHGSAPNEHDVHVILNSEFRAALQGFADEMAGDAP